MNCQKCGQPLVAGAQFCGNCGTPISRKSPMFRQTTFKALVAMAALTVLVLATLGLRMALRVAPAKPDTSNPTDSLTQSTTGDTKPIGSSFKLKDAAGNGFTVSLLRYYASATPTGKYNPGFGSQIAAVYLVITGTGPGKASTTPYAETAAVDASGQSFGARAVSVAECTPQYPTAVTRLSRGQAASGCIAFQMPIGIRITTIAFTPTNTTNTVNWSL